MNTKDNNEMPLNIDASGYKKYEWLVIKEREQDYRDKRIAIPMFPKTRNETSNPRILQKVKIFYRGSTTERKQFSKDVHEEMQKSLIKKN